MAMVKLNDIVHLHQINWPRGFFKNLTSEDESAIRSSDSFFVTDISPDGLVELEYSKRLLSFGWVYLDASCITPEYTN